ncbi:MAG: glycosyltransferase family 4 protein [Solirubrobacterales bacterium]
MGLLFYPRGGSAQVVRYLVPALERAGWPVALVAGSLGAPGDRRHAQSFFKHARLTPVAYDDAVRAHEEGLDAHAQGVPMHPSFEDRPGAPDKVFASLVPAAGEHQVRAWMRILRGAWAESPSILHLHHLTPLHEAAAELFAGTPLVTHLHGTEILLLEQIDRLSAIAHSLGTDLAGMAGGPPAGWEADEDLTREERHLVAETRWDRWVHGEHWSQRLRAAAARSDRVVAISPHLREAAAKVLALPPERLLSIPNGVDVSRFERRTLSASERLERWRNWLVEAPQGWDESGVPGTIGYRDEDLRWFERGADGGHPPVLLFVGRFTETKRVPMLIRAYARARERFSRPAPLVVWGGFPGEWEGEHPASVAREVGPDGIFFVGWRGHTELPDGLACADVMVAPSAREGFGQMLVEAMACGLPVIATRSGGPTSFVNTDPGQPNGWMLDPDDEEGLVEALVEAVNDSQARRARGEAAYEQVRRSHSWDAVARRFGALYEELLAGRQRSPAVAGS